MSEERSLSILQTTQRHWGVRPESKPRIKRFSECGVESVEVDQCVRGDSVEGQRANKTVHIYCYSTRGGGGGGGGGGGDGCSSVIVTDIVTTIRAAETPGLIIFSKPAVITASSPDSSVTHWYRNVSSPLYLPVTATSQAISTQQLRPVIKPVWVIRVWLILLYVCHLLVVVRQFDLPVDCVCVDCEFTGIWWREENKYSCIYYVV